MRSSGDTSSLHKSYDSSFNSIIPTTAAARGASARTPSPASYTQSRIDATPRPPRAKPALRDTNSSTPLASDDEDDDDLASTFLDTTRGPSGSRPTTQTMSLKQQEAILEKQQTHIFNLQLENTELERRLKLKVPEDITITVKENIRLKSLSQSYLTKLQEMKKDVKALKKREREGDSLRKELEESRRLVSDLEDRLARRSATPAATPNRSLVDERANQSLVRRNAELVEQVDEERNRAEDAMAQVEELEERNKLLQAEARRANSGPSAAELDLQQRLQEFERENIELREEAQRLADAVEDRDVALGVRDDLLVEKDEHLRQLDEELGHLERRLERVKDERSESRAAIHESQEEREEILDELNAVRDKYNALDLEHQQLIAQVEEDHREYDRLREDLEFWEAEGKAARSEADRLADDIRLAQSEYRSLEAQHADLEAAHQTLSHSLADLQDRVASHTDGVAEEREQWADDLASANSEIQRLNDRTLNLEEELEEQRERLGHELDDALNRAQISEEKVDSLKDKLVRAKAELEENRALLDTVQARAHDHAAREDDLAAELEDSNAAGEKERQARLRAEREARESGEKLADAEDEIRTLRRDLDTLERDLSRQLDEAMSALEEAKSSLKSTRALLSQRESDLHDVQSALRALESEKQKLGESHTTDKFSLELELDRLKRDLERSDDELQRVREELRAKESAKRNVDGSLDKLHAENRDLASQLAAQTQARLNIGEKLDAAQTSLKEAEASLATAKARVSELEQKLNRDQRSLLANENQYRDQLTERNTLLLTVYQYLDKIVGVDKTPKKGGAAETKPYTNFASFHDNIMNRLKFLNKVRQDFEQRVKDAETKFADKLAEDKKLFESRWKQLDRFEKSLKALTEQNQNWRRRFHTQEGDLEAAKAANTELASQISGLRRSTPYEGAELRSARATAKEAENRARTLANQLAQSEERIARHAAQSDTATTKWEARVKEYERQIKEMKESHKRDRQGAKERVAELEALCSNLKKQVDQMNRRTQQLNDVMEAAASRPSSGRL